jgi:hypothetical protein
MNEIDLRVVLVRQVSALVSETANILCDSPEPSEVMRVEANLYRLLVVNCEEKARMAEEMGAQARRLQPKQENSPP